MSLSRNVRECALGAEGLIWLSVCLLTFGFPIQAVAQSQQAPSVEAGLRGTLNDQGPVGEPSRDRELSGHILGTVIDQAGGVAVGAQVRLAREDQSQEKEVLSGDTGQFSFANLASGPFELTITAAGFETQRFNGELGPGQVYMVPAIRIAIATVVTEVHVGLPLVEVARDQVKEQEKQRVLGFIPNFYVSYVPNAAPLAAKQKFELAWKSTIDPFTFVGVGALAGVQQANNDFEEYGQGMQGYAKRFGAAYADVVSGTFIGSAILPSLLKQDPRYFYKGTGSPRSRVLYAFANTVICKGDNKRWQPNYSGILGSFATGGLSYLYYPTSDHTATEIIVQNSLIRLGETAFENVLQEFVIRRLTPRLQHHPPAQP
jgi:hypothetical protein